MSNNKNKPSLRFPEFTGEWIEKKLGEVFDFRNGYTPSKSNPKYWNGGTIPWFRLEDIRDSGNILLDSIQHITTDAIKGAGVFKANSIIVATSATIGEHALIKVEHLANQRFTNLYPNTVFLNEVDMMYAFYYMFIIDEICKTNINIGTFASVNMTAFSRIPYLIPPTIAEQQKIAACLSEMDSLLTAQGQKIEALKDKKKGLMQQLFPLHGETTPRLRFPEFTGEWVVKKLRDILYERKESSIITEELPQLSFTIADGVIWPEDRKTNQRDFLMKDKDNKKFLITRKNDIIYNPANVIYGAIHKNSLCDGVVSPIYKIFWSKENSNFLNYLLRRPCFISRLASHAEGTVTKLKTLKAEAFLDMPVPFPVNPLEQIKIAECLTSLDDLVAAESAKLDALKNYKKGLMQQLFPQQNR